MKKKLLCLFMVIVVTFSIVVNDYNEAKAVTGVEETLLISALLSFVSSMAIVKSGIVPDAAKILADFIEGDTIDASDVHTMINELVERVNSGADVSDEDMEMYNAWVDGVKEFYLEFIRDMNKTGVVDEDSALSYILNLFDYDYVSEEDIETAFSKYCLLSATVQASSDVVKFSVSGNTVACNKTFAKLFGQDMAVAINLYMQKRQLALENGDVVSFKGNADYSTIFDLSSGIVFPVGSEGDIQIREIISSGYPYVIINSSSEGTGNIVILTKKSSSIVLFGTCTSKYNWCWLGGDVSSSSPYGLKYQYDLEGNLLDTNTTKYIWQHSLRYIYYYGNGFYFDDNILELWGSPVLPETNDYPIDGIEDIPVVASLPIDDIYDGSESRGQDIDLDDENDVDTIYSIDSSINDLADEIANLRVVIDNIDTDMPYDDYAKAIEDAILNVNSKADSAIDTDVKEQIAVDLGIVDWNINDFTTSGLGSKFPFCIPYDLINLISVFDAEPLTPKFEIPFVFENYGINESISVDLSDFDDIAELCRTLEVIFFIGLLIMKTRNIIKG